MADETRKQSEALIDRLRKHGHQSAAERLARAVESGVVFVLRETLETLLTGVEAIDPVTETMMEELRLEVEKLLGAPGAKPPR